MISGADNITELHALWDSTIYEWDMDVQQPLNDSAWSFLGNISSMLRQEHPVTEQQMAQDLTKPESQWANEGYALATSVVYQLKEFVTPQKAYIDKAKQVVHYQLAKGGYRLAQLLTSIFGKKEELFLQ